MSFDEVQKQNRGKFSRSHVLLTISTCTKIEVEHFLEYLFDRINFFVLSPIIKITIKMKLFLDFWIIFSIFFIKICVTNQQYLFAHFIFHYQQQITSHNENRNNVSVIDISNKFDIYTRKMSNISILQRLDQWKTIRNADWWTNTNNV